MLGLYYVSTQYIIYKYQVYYDQGIRAYVRANCTIYPYARTVKIWPKKNFTGKKLKWHGSAGAAGRFFYTVLPVCYTNKYTVCTH